MEAPRRVVLLREQKHVVPLAWSWSRGAHEWSNESGLRFANDLVNLLPVEASWNRSKGAKGPDQWLALEGAAVMSTGSFGGCDYTS
nr:DUF1524 domain-containing protein [Marinobacter sp.]